MFCGFEKVVALGVVLIVLVFGMVYWVEHFLAGALVICWCCFGAMLRRLMDVGLVFIIDIDYVFYGVFGFPFTIPRHLPVPVFVLMILHFRKKYAPFQFHHISEFVFTVWALYMVGPGFVMYKCKMSSSRFCSTSAIAIFGHCMVVAFPHVD